MAKPISADARPVVLTRQRNLKMARSAHAFVRGNTAQFYDWLESEASRPVPAGPSIWICGDCHVGNLGPVADARGRIAIQIRDFDQTVIGNPAHDLIRLGLSLATAARGSDLPGVTTANMLEEMIAGYVEGLDEKSDSDDISHPKCVQIVMKQASARTWKHLARERIRDTEPTIPLGSNFWPLSKPERREMAKLFAGEDVRRLVTMLKTRDNASQVELLDAAYWMKGCSSLGRLRFAALLSVDSDLNELCLIDIKEATKPAAPRLADADMPHDNAERVVAGATRLAPSLGKRMMAARFGDHAVFVRELLPQDLKLEIDELSRGEATKAARFLARVVGHAHGRQMDAPTRRRWAATLRQQRSKSLDAPSWLWSSVVDLVALHEAAYLEHCRRFVAMESEFERRLKSA